MDRDVTEWVVFAGVITASLAWMGALDGIGWRDWLLGLALWSAGSTLLVGTLGTLVALGRRRPGL